MIKVINNNQCELHGTMIELVSDIGLAYNSVFNTLIQSGYSAKDAAEILNKSIISACELKKEVTEL